MKASTRAGVVKLAAASRLGATVLVALAAVRVAVVATLGAVSAHAPGLATLTAPPPVAASASPVDSSRAGRVQKATGTSGKSVLVNLVVTVGGRSEVYVDQGFVGKSPYIGDVSCKVGGTVTIQVVPAKGAPRVFKRACVEGGTIQIGD